MSRIVIIILIFGGLVLTACSTKISSDATRKMTGERLAELIQKFDKTAELKGNSVEFKLKDRDLYFVFDSKADRMRIITPIAQAALADEDILVRMMQANFDAVLDARYAFGNKVIWATYIHPLSSLTQEDFLSGVAQTVTAAETFGSSYTSGAMVFGLNLAIPAWIRKWAQLLLDWTRLMGDGACAFRLIYNLCRYSAQPCRPERQV